MSSATNTLLRQRGHHDSSRVGMIELFFDLVFVFAVTQLSHSLLATLTFTGAAQMVLLLPAVWWVWIYTSWTTNWLNPERLPVRLCLFAMMIAGLVLAASIPAAFGERGIMFACAYAFMQIGRTLFVLWAVRTGPSALFDNFRRILVWLALASVLWIVGGMASVQTRFAWWTAALAIELAGPAFLFWIPGLGGSRISDWDIDGAHMAERCALFVIIALGESLLITGATFSELNWSAASVIGMLIAVVGSIAMWWVYFDTGAERAQHRIVHAQDPGQQGRIAYTYLHLLIVAGIIVCAVADELVLVHPGHAERAGVVTILCGPLLYLLGNMLFKWVTNDRTTPPLSHMIGIALLAALTPFAWGHGFSALALSTLTTVILVVVATWESIALRRPAAA
ncbi:MAG TPA: low temperature requirement protein A [Povalibacter sp.]|nr:low temperature requirement protein A [Povalibacter sp.]